MILFLIEESSIFAKQVNVFTKLKQLGIETKLCIIPHYRNGIMYCANKQNLINEYNLNKDDVLEGYTEECESIIAKDIKELGPSCCFFSRPYDSLRNALHYTTNIKKFCKIFYIDYGYPLLNLDTVHYKVNTYKIFDIIFCVNHYQYVQFQKHGVKKQNLVISGYTVFDVEAQQYAINEQMITYWPRWTMNTAGISSTFLQYHNFLSNLNDYTKCQYHINFRYHPLLEVEMNEKKYLTKEYFEEFQKKCNNRNVQIEDCNKSHTNSLQKSKWIISDYTSLLADAIFYKKNILLLDNNASIKSNFNKVGLALLPYTKIVKCPNDILTALNNGNALHVVSKKDLAKLKNLIYGRFTFWRWKNRKVINVEDIIKYRVNSTLFICNFLIKNFHKHQKTIYDK